MQGKNNLIYIISKEDLEDKNVLFDLIYKNEEQNYYLTDDFSKDFYIELAFYGFISTSAILYDKFYLLPEIQFEYAILDFSNLHISKKVQKLLKKDDFEFCVNKNIPLVLENIEKFHKQNWLEKEYKDLILSLVNYKHQNIDFEIKSFELYDKTTKELIAGEIGYRINKTYTSLCGFSSKDKEYNNWGKLQMVNTALFLEKNGYSFWNLGHPYMQYKFDLGAISYTREEFLKRWLPKEI
jgi:Leu/Phe-tRNA-protein transferase